MEILQTFGTGFLILAGIFCILATKRFIGNKVSEWVQTLPANAVVLINKLGVLGYIAVGLLLCWWLGHGYQTFKK